MANPPIINLDIDLGIVRDDDRCRNQQGKSKQPTRTHHVLSVVPGNPVSHLPIPLNVVGECEAPFGARSTLALAANWTTVSLTGS